MKKLICMLLVLTLLFSFVACAAEGKEDDSSPEVSTDTSTDAPSQPEVAIGSALEILENVWALYGEDEKFFAMGGDYENMVDGAPGSFGLTDAAALDSLLAIPEDQAAKLDDAASLIHAMNANTFTGGAFHLADAGEVAAFADSVKAHVLSRQWLCGFPETLLIVQVSEGYVVSAFGDGEIVETFKSKLLSAYETATVLVEEPIV